MPGVSREQIDRAKEVNILDYILAHEPNNVKRVGNTHYLKDHDSLRISNGLWKWESHGIGGKNVVDYLIKVRGYDFVDAVRHLAGEDLTAPRTVTSKERLPTEEQHPAEREPLKLPRRFDNNNRVIEYLQSRGIDETLIQKCIRRNILYESADFHNAVFVGRDEHGKARFAALRGTHGDFKCDAEGSDKRYGFCLPPENPNCRTVFVFESPIDILSYDTLCKLGYIEPQDGWRLSLGGTSMLALTNLIERQKFQAPIAHCVVCTDRDTAGNLAHSEIAAKLTIKVSRSVPVGKDWNETLQKIRNEVKNLDDVRKDIRFIDSGYKTLFTIKDGDSIKITRFDGEQFIKPCRFIDETHTQIGSDSYHICEFAERMEKNGNKYEAVSGGEPILHILAGKYGEKLQDWGIAMTDAAIRQRVGGDYTVEPLYGASNSTVFGALVRGKDGIAVCGIEGDTLTSLHPYWAQKFKRELSPVEKPAPEKADFIGKIDKFKAKAAAQETTAPNPRKSRDGLE